MQRKTDRQPDHRIDMRGLVLTLTISVFLSLMSFLIVLNALSSSSAARQAGVTKSLSNAFGFIGKGDSPLGNAGEGKGKAGDSEEVAAGLVRSALPDVGFQSRKTASGGRIMAVTVKRSELEARWPGLQSRLGSLFKNKNIKGYKMQILALDGAGKAAELATLARYLSEEEGIDEDRIAVGFENRGRPAVEIRFIGGGGT